MQLVSSFLIVETGICIQRLPRIPDAIVRLQIHVFVFHATPLALIVQPTPFAINADLDFVPFQRTNELRAGKLKIAILFRQCRHR
jgi:hypothetical protein